MRTISLAQLEELRTIVRKYTEKQFGFQMGGDLGYGMRFIDDNRQQVIFGRNGGRALVAGYYLGILEYTLRMRKITMTDAETDAMQRLTWDMYAMNERKQGGMNSADWKIEGQCVAEAWFSYGQYTWKAPTAGDWERHYERPEYTNAMLAASDALYAAGEGSYGLADLMDANGVR